MDIEVKMGETAVSTSADTLTATGIGSCVVITLYDPKSKIGALSHTMLPSHSQGSLHQARDTKYIEVAIEEVLRKMLALGAKQQDIEAKLIGAANMFPEFESDIGKQNVLSAKDKLKKEGIRLVGDCVGGSIGRSVDLDIASGLVTVKMKF